MPFPTKTMTPLPMIAYPLLAQAWSHFGTWPFTPGWFPE
jgi:hypothetical protein